jgi:hypothetical protein
MKLDSISKCHNHWGVWIKVFCNGEITLWEWPGRLKACHGYPPSPLLTSTLWSFINPWKALCRLWNYTLVLICTLSKYLVWEYKEKGELWITGGSCISCFSLTSCYFRTVIPCVSSGLCVCVHHSKSTAFCLKFGDICVHASTASVYVAQTC